MSALGLLSLGCALLVNNVAGFYLPGAAPHDYKPGERVDLLVNALTPMLANEEHAKLKSLINYDYYNPAFHFCQPQGGPKAQPERLGSVLFGDRIFNSPFDIKMLEDDGVCKKLCTVTDISSEDAKFINERIREDYALNWLVDGLPAAEKKVDNKTGDIFYDMGFNLGVDDGEFYANPALNNHYEILLEYHTPASGSHRVVGVVVWPSSRGGDQTGDVSCDSRGPPLHLDQDAPSIVTYTYRVKWSESTTPWATRWDNYLRIFDPKIHWFNLINSIFFVVFLCVMVSMILLRAVSRDISRYNAMDLSEDVQEDFGWKLVHGEVFRSPRYSLILSVFVGNGAQLCAMTGVTLVFALFGFLSPSNRGSIATVMMVCWTFFGGVSGYIASRVYASLGGTEKKKLAFLAATILPAAIFAIVFLLNLFLIMAGSSGAVPFTTLLLIVFLWFGISAPLSAIGSYYGAKHGGVSHPVRVNPIPRQIPPKPRYLEPWATTIFSGVLPFGAATVELHYVMSSLFASKAYYAFGFLALTAGVVALTTATITILFTYFILCAEEYRWHWRAFLAGGGSAIWVFGYGIVYWLTQISTSSGSSFVLYLGYLILMSALVFLMTGSIGFLAGYWAVLRLYSRIRVD